jgi:hypothetical protein
MLRTLWSAGYERVMTPAWAGREQEAIFAPCLSIFGVSTPDEFLEAVSGGDVKDGTLNRFLILPEARHVPARPPIDEGLRLPERLASRLRALRGGNPASALVDVCLPAAPDGASPLRLEWEETAKRLWHGLEAKLDALAAREDGKSGDEVSFFARTPEMALRIASIIAAGRGSTSVNVADVIWGTELASRSAHSFMAAFRSHVSASDHSARVEFVEAVIKQARTITRSGLTRAAGKRMDARQLDSIVRQMVDGEKIAVQHVRKGARGPQAVAYRWL